MSLEVRAGPRGEGEASEGPPGANPMLTLGREAIHDSSERQETYDPRIEWVS